MQCSWQGLHIFRELHMVLEPWLSHMSKFNPYLTIWIRSRSTFEYFLKERNTDSMYGLPFVIYGISHGLGMSGDIRWLFDAPLEPRHKLLSYALGSVVGIGATYLMLAFVSPWILQLIGKIWKGQATTSDLANVTSLSIIPYCLVLVYQLAFLVIGEEPSLHKVNGIFQYLVWIFSFRLLVIGVSVAQRFNYGISLLNILLAYLPFLLLRLMISV